MSPEMPLVTLAALPGSGHAETGIPPGWGLLIGFLLVALNGFFVAAEFALVKVRPTQIEPMASEGVRRARVARHMVRHLDAYLSATQLGITLASLALGWVGEPAFAWIVRPLLAGLARDNPQLVQSVSLTVSFLVITILHIVLGELAPKSIAIRKAEGTALVVALPLYVFYKLTYPAIWVLNHTANRLLRLVGIAPAAEGELAHDEEELRLLLSSTNASQLSTQKRELLDNIFELSHRVARQIMLPRQDVVYLSTSRQLAENLRIARRSGHTRFPLCDGDLDHVVGLIHIKDLFRRDRPLTSLQEVARDIAFVPETLELDRLLKRMRTERFHMAAVIDEYGGVSGVVTLEDVIEEIVGAIQDEFDVENPELLARGDGVYEVSGGMLVEDLEEALGVELSERDEDTIGGVVLSELGRNPAEGDHIELGPVTLEVLEVQHNRVNTVRVTVLQPETVPPEE
ncbi:MAG TPA: hemolysin family protein [Thermoanaerobaculia bacterium]|jgi:CBS domain containing-hemolysin-like protein|nr:hemolysin family protein [Thermoanaerobaculia bacterium]